MSIEITIGETDFDAGALLKKIQQQNSHCGAVVSFLGLVRDINQDAKVQSLTLEHYPKMTERCLHDIAEQAIERFSLSDVVIYHRVGTLTLNEQIVFVAVNAKHRESAFLGCQFVMDYLKTKAPFWKKEQRNDQAIWLEQNDKDKQALTRWHDDEHHLGSSS